MAFTRCESYSSIKVGGVLHFPPMGRGPAFSLVAIFHLAYAARRESGWGAGLSFTFLPPGSNLSLPVMELFDHPCFGAEPSIGKPIRSASRINQPDMDPDGILLANSYTPCGL